MYFRFRIKLELYITAEGYTLPSGYILKELSILFPNREYKHFIFKKPDSFIPTDKDNYTIRFTTDKLNQLSFTEGDIPYNIINDILTPYKDYRIYTYSYPFQKFLQNILPTTTLINIQSCGYKLPEYLPKPNCFKNHKARYCSLAKAKAVSRFVESGQYIEK